MKRVSYWLLLLVSITLVLSSCSEIEEDATDNSINTTTSDDSTDNYSSSTNNSSGLFIAVGASGTLLTSSDGTTWTAQTSGTLNNLR